MDQVSYALLHTYLLLLKDFTTRMCAITTLHTLFPDPNARESKGKGMTLCYDGGETSFSLQIDQRRKCRPSKFTTARGRG